MADKRLAYDTRGKDDMFADDDPLAELARIVGFEPRIAANTVDEPERQEPALDLEDELLREFERYDAPRPLAALDHPAEPTALEVEAYDYVEPVQDEVPSIGEELALPVATDFETPVVEPELPEAIAVAPEVAAPEPVTPDWEASVAADWAPAPSRPVAVPAEPPLTFTAYGGARDLIEELELSIGGALPVAPAVQPPAKAPQWSAASIRLPLANFHAPRREEPVLSEPVIEAPVIEPAPVEAFAAEPELVAEPEFTAEAEVVVPHVAEEPLPVAAVEAADFEPVAASFGFPAEIDRHEEVALPEEPVASFEDVAAFEEPVEPDNAGFDLIAAAAEGDVHPDAALTEALPEPAFDADAFDLDDLLADVSRYPVPQRASSPIVPEPVAAAPEPVVAPPAPQPAPAPAAPVFQAPVFEAPVFEAPLFEAPVFEAPVARASVQPTVIAPVPMSRATPVLRQPEAPKPVVQAPVEPVSQPIAPAPIVARQPELEAEDPFAGHDFELDLAGIELELADLDFSEPPAPQPKPEPVRVAPVVAAQPAPRPQPAPVFVPQPAPVSYAKPAPASESNDDLPFDPSMISDPEDRPETVEDMHVPTLPPVEHPEPVAKTADFDFDLDAEIASFFEPAKRQEKAPAWAPPAAAVAAAAVAKPTSSAFADGLDDFERALEEDFRRSVREPVERRENVSEVHIESASQTADFNRARSMRRLLAAAAILVVFAGGAYGVYTWVSNGPGLSIVSSGEPRVITADKDPVKVAPENPGGKTVPNQDKAVYDRVAGAAEEPKQKALVSSDEAPVDVVQRTLTPEVSPDDDEGSADPVMPTAVGETQDPRLLPDHNATADASAADDDATPSVSPRKVRTMIVKPDGTLVAREEPAPAEQSAPADEVASATPAAQPGATPSAASFPASTGNQVASTALPPVGAAPATQPVQTTAKVAEVNAANADQVDPPVRAVKTTPITDAAGATTDTAPVPTARPVDQPVNVVGTVTENGNVRPTAQQKPTQVASAPAAAAQPVTQAPAAAASGGYGIQIASLPSEDEAKKSYASLSKKFAGVLGGRAYEIRKADIAGKGTFYRVRIPAGSKDEAAALCEQYRSAGGSCLISR